MSEPTLTEATLREWREDRAHGQGVLQARIDQLLDTLAAEERAREAAEAELAAWKSAAIWRGAPPPQPTSGPETGLGAPNSPKAAGGAIGPENGAERSDS